jgi:YidC/Oxa1 family membrane protein insertase
MTDMRRTLLWVVFTMSLVLLWDAWNKHTGQPTFFGAQPARPPRRRGHRQRRGQRPFRAADPTGAAATGNRLAAAAAAATGARL